MADNKCATDSICPTTHRVDENMIKVEAAIKDIDKLRDSLHQLEIDFASLSQKISDQHNFMSEKIINIMDNMKAIHSTVDEIKADNIQRKGFLQATKSIFIHHPIIMQAFLIALLVTIVPTSVKEDFVKTMAKLAMPMKQDDSSNK